MMEAVDLSLSLEGTRVEIADLLEGDLEPPSVSGIYG